MVWYILATLCGIIGIAAVLRVAEVSLSGDEFNIVQVVLAFVFLALAVRYGKKARGIVATKQDVITTPKQ